MPPEGSSDKSHRGNASQFFVAGELCRRGLMAVVTMGNCPNTDVLCSNKAGTKFAHIQVKTFIPGNKACSVGMKAEKALGANFFWVLGGIPEPGQQADFIYYVIPPVKWPPTSRQNSESGSRLRGKMTDLTTPRTPFELCIYRRESPKVAGILLPTPIAGI